MSVTSTNMSFKNAEYVGSDTTVAISRTADRENIKADNLDQIAVKFENSRGAERQYENLEELIDSVSNSRLEKKASEKSVGDSGMHDASIEKTASAAKNLSIGEVLSKASHRATDEIEQMRR
ncbi:hypothetical protein [Dyella nitratireducens]|uniref:Uncharacterized protein n=1 Tax=Dyella nitratireducens TaxID=1849580 RepID=A0ABQ1FNH9_9GAMM|nr:hypothetical protein [Dyella nitratireducens]GGA23474.1 hypothetical protein GCM10010981_09740 [Dyella nitratireducens]GLQ43963.1 hypothetical protein GCM10007902_38130 [Dyella nitratireducens]